MYLPAWPVAPGYRLVMQAKEPDSVLNDVDVGQCIQSIADCIIYDQYIPVAASAAKCQEPCLCQATPNRGVLEQHDMLP